jgi:hypothetical protein
MKWFKHMASAHLDADMQALISDHGYEGFGVYWSIIETLSMHLKTGSEPVVNLPIKSWKNPAISDKKWMKIVQFLAEKGKISVEISGKFVTIGCHKLLEICDEYRKKADKMSGQTPDGVQIPHARSTSNSSSSSFLSKKILN